MDKKITILGEEFFYRLDFSCGEYSDYEFTTFYKKKALVVRRKYIFFGPKITEEVPVSCFTVNFWINDPNYTKEKLRDILEERIRLYYRAEEIQRGELI